MRIPNQACVLVTDGRKMLFLRNRGDAAFPQLETLRKAEDVNPPDRDLKSDAPGRTYLSAGGGAARSAYDEVDRHRGEEEAFARATALFLAESAAAGEFDSLIVVADPRTLGRLRDQYSPQVEDRLIAELAKDLVKHPVTEIETIIARS